MNHCQQINIKSFALAFVVGCAVTRAQVMEAAPKLAPTCRAAVHLYTAPDRVPAPYEDLALLRVVGNDFAGEGTLFGSLKGKAAELGANGLIYRSMDTSPGLFQDPSGEAVAIYIPTDTARIAGECAREKIATDSVRRAAERPNGLP